MARMGITKAVLTEAVRALACQDTVVAPDEVVVLVAKPGKDRFCDERLSGMPSVWTRMCGPLRAAEVVVDSNLVELHNSHNDSRIDWFDTSREGSRFANLDDIDDLRETLSELRKKLQAAGFADVDALVPQRGRLVAFPSGRIAVIKER